MKNYTLSKDTVSRETETILDYMDKKRGGNVQHFKVYKDHLYWEPKDTSGKQEWTERQLDIHSITVEGYLLLRETFLLHQEAINDRNWNAVEFTLEQLNTTVFTAFSTAVERMREITESSTTRRKAGESGGRPPRIATRYATTMTSGCLRAARDPWS